MTTGMAGGAALEKRSAAVSPGLLGRLLEQLGRVKGAGRYVTVPGLRMRGADIDAAARMFGGGHRTADPSKYAVWLNRALNKGGPTPDLLVDKSTPLLHNPSFIIERLGKAGWSASPEALRAAGVMQVNAAPLRSLNGGPFVATRPEMQAFENGLFPFRSMYGRLAVGRDAAGRPIYVPWRISNHVNTVVPVREVTGASGAGKYYDALYGVDAGVDPRLTTSGQSSRGSFDLFVPRGRETGVRFDWQEPYDLTGFYGGPRMGGPRDWGGIARGFGLQKQSAAAAAPAGRGWYDLSPDDHTFPGWTMNPTERGEYLQGLWDDYRRTGDTSSMFSGRRGSTVPWQKLSLGTYVPSAAAPAQPAQPVPPAPPVTPAAAVAIPRVGFSMVGYNGATQPVGTYGRGGFRARAAGLRTLRAPTPDTVAAQAASAAAAPAVRASGEYAARALNHLAGLEEFQRRVGDGDTALGRERIATATRDLQGIPLVNENAGIGAAMSHTRNGAGSWISFPASAANFRGTYRGAGKWLDGIATHEAAHPFTRKIQGYVDKIKAIQGAEGIPGNTYHTSPVEQAAELNALRALKGAWPGQGAGPGGAYTEEQADAILDNKNPYFKGLPVNYKMRLLNEARNRRLRRYGMARTAVV